MKPKEPISERAKAKVYRTTAMIVLLAGMVLVWPQVLAAESGSRRLPVAEFRDKMKGAWLGQMIGVGWGAPTEKGPVSGHFSTEGHIMPEDRMPPWKPEMVNQHNNDDCYVEMTFMKTLETYGFDVSIRQAGIDFANSGFGLAHANRAGRTNLRDGIAPPDSGHPQFNKHADDIDYQIESDFSGIISPGMPNQVIALSDIFGRLMNYGDGRYAGQFIGGMYAEAYFESDMVKVIEAGLACVPDDSQYAEMIRDTLKWYKDSPTEWQKTWQLVEDKYHKDPRYTHGLCSEPGGDGGFSIDAKLNGAFMIMGLLYGKGDPDQTMRIACHCGQDSDCNPANAGGIYFAVLGYSKIPGRFIEKLNLNATYSASDYTVPKVCEVSERLVRQAVLRRGGKIEKDANGDDVFVIPVQTPNPGKAEKSCEPGPIANSRFTAEEMAKITMKGQETRIPKRVKSNSIKPPLFKVSAALPDAAEVLSPSAVRMEGWLGARITANEKNRLLVVDTEPLLSGYRKKPGTHPWLGEHVGKWMHAATLAWDNTGDAALREKLDRVAAGLIASQEPDGYLGTYVPEQRFGLFKGADWDVWSHKYNLMGLLTYYQYTGNEAALTACRKMGDLLIATFPAKKSILAAGTHMGMAATSVLEPMVLLYRCTGDKRYLDFCRYIVKSWDEPDGPKIIATLLAEKSVNKTANGKAYEMLSNLVGLCELARATGDRTLLEPVLIAWGDIVTNRLYITGSASAHECFQADNLLPNESDAHICETCVTVTWIQLNLQLLRLTGEARFGDELERSFYNHLAAAQNPRGDDWCYYTPLEGTKKYDDFITCCHSSGPRGFALAPQTAYLRGKDTLLVDTFETSRAMMELGGRNVIVEQQSKFPRAGASVLTLRMSGPARFAIKIRVPAWAAPLTAGTATVKDGWAELPMQEWKDGDQINVKFNLAERVVVGEQGNVGRTAKTRGPFVLARDLKTGKMVPFADAGANGDSYRVWVPVFRH